MRAGSVCPEGQSSLSRFRKKVAFDSGGKPDYYIYYPAQYQTERKIPMAKKQSFADKAKRKDKDAFEYIKVVKAYKADNGAWKFRTQVVAVNDANRNELYS
jgi:hypothetical protein